jgi:hypothetical protein
MYHSCTKYRSCTKLPCFRVPAKLPCFLRNTPPHPPTRIASPSPQLVAAHTLPFMHQCTVHAPTPVHAPNCLPCVHQTAFHAVLEPVRPSASVLGVRSDANTYVLLQLRPRVVPALKGEMRACISHERVRPALCAVSVCVRRCARDTGVRSEPTTRAPAPACKGCVCTPCPVAGTSKARVRAALRACWCAYHSVGCASARCALHTFKALP